MSLFAKLTGLAQQTLDKSGSSQQNRSSGQTDWRGIVRGAADALTGDGRSSERPSTANAPDLARAAARTEPRRHGVLKALLARVGGGDSRSAGGVGRGALLGGGAAGAGLGDQIGELGSGFTFPRLDDFFGR